MVSAKDASGNESDPVVVYPPRSLSKPSLADLSDMSVLSLEQNHPNPFNPETVIKYNLPEDVSVRLVVYNVLGQEVRELVNAAQTAGVYAVRWNGQDDLGRQVSSGLYLYRLEAGANVVMKKMLLMK